MNDKLNGPITLTATENDAGRRLDRILRKHFSAFPLSFINRLLREKKVRVGGTARDGAYRVVRRDHGGTRGAISRPFAPRRQSRETRAICPRALHRV
ncbi:MAG: hypothetical protein LBG27_02610 [Spirochaetaceae bacterium]|jgi:23S rRNA-/tRNA-specific pseudouridylate synthase|nr:hypothetical protein [Spirochaetaceae bacterium]